MEIDESKFRKRKYHRGKRVQGVWVFGRIERDSSPIKCFFDRSASTLIPIIKQWILRGTNIYSDCWKAYSTLVTEGYIHNTVNHSVQFVSDTGAHTNNTESRWNAVKKSLPRFGTRKELYDLYFAECCVRRKYLQSANNPFIEFLRLISTVYHLPQQQPAQSLQPPVATLPADGLLSAAAIDSSASVCLSMNMGIANYDLRFDLTDISEFHLETSGIKFL